MPIHRWLRLAPVTAVVLAVAAHTVASVGAATAETPDPRIADLVKNGKLRVGVFPPQYVKDAAGGELKSAWVEVARALATRMGVQLVLLEHPTPLKDIDCLKAGECDVILLPFDDRAANVGDFSAPYMQFEYTLLVPGDSPIRHFAGADRKGIRIAAVRNHASTNTLIPLLKQAELVYAETPDPTFDLLRGKGRCNGINPPYAFRLFRKTTGFASA